MAHMECLLGSIRSIAIAFPPFSAPNSRRYHRRRHHYHGLKVKLTSETDPLFHSAMNSASLRFQETHRPEPLLVDPYAGCFVDPNMQMGLSKNPHPYCIATKFVDDKLLRTVHHIDGLKQVVLLTDGMDTRPYRLNWPSSTMIFDVSPERIFKTSAQKLQGVGAKIPRRCLHVHVPMESPNIEEALRAKGFNGNLPSIWALQGLPIMTLASFEDILYVASCLVVQGGSFVGELPAWLSETEIGATTKPSMNKWMSKLFMGNGFKVDTISYDEVATNLGKELAPGSHNNILFVAEQLRYSDDQ
ncbi:O-methyltransferase 1, chloroplastic [Linum grandiflorum]